MPAPAKISQLVQRFAYNLDAYRSGQYNETQVRREFIDPFLKELGWDIDNEKGYAEQYKEVVHEDAIRVGQSTKAPDYSLRIGGQRKLFVEAKKPSVYIKEDTSPAFQVRRYAWSAKLPLSILTDFEEFAVYDCRDKPDKSDKAGHARIMYLNFRQYEEKWDELVALFSPAAIMQGAFDKFAQSSQKKRGTAEVDDAFLADISEWRSLLARNIALRNPGIRTRELNHAVQVTIDRLIFLRIAEDRGIEPYGRLREATVNEGVYGEFGRLFQLADLKYDSGLFYFRAEKGRGDEPDDWTLNLTLDDKLLRQIVKGLYYPDCPYQFDVIPADILGQVYEQFLGKVIRLTAGGQAKVEEKPEVKKAGGVYYTPTYIVNYIVAQTVGKLLVGRQPGPKGDASKLRILDPACGSGSFLIGAYQHLLDWHLGQYLIAPEKWARGREPTLYQSGQGGWRLTIGERKRILLNNIYGVDIDAQAVEVTKLSLLLKVMEGETEATLGTQLRLLPERVLPDLSRNIQCGNSLIGPDFYEGQQAFGFIDEEEMYRINVFDWAAAFPEVVQWGGFDAVIGNPPYIQSRSEMMTEKDKTFYAKNFRTAQYQLNTYGLFIEKGVGLLKSNAYLGMIIPNYWLSTGADSLLRQYIFLENEVIEITNMYRVFANATVDTLILILKHTDEPKFPKQLTVQAVDRQFKTISERLAALVNNNWGYSRIHTLYSEQKDVEISFSDRLQLKGEKTLADYLNFRFGMKPYQVGKGKPPQTRQIVEGKIFNSDHKLDENYRPLLYARGVKRYSLEWQGEWIKYGEHLAEPRSLNLFEGERLLIRRIISKPNVEGTYTNEPYICNTDVITLQKISDFNFPDLRFFLGVLLSLPFATFLRSQNVNLDRAAFPKINTKTLSIFPIPELVYNNMQHRELHNKMVGLVTQMLELHKRLVAARLAQERGLLQRQIAATDNQIDRLVYQLYALTPEEIAIVEGSS